MVKLILYSPKGNQGVRYFPYNGYLGLTPLRVEGVVCTRLFDNHKSLPAKNITVSVRCYEARIGRVSNLQSNILVDHTQVLWSKPDDQEYADVADNEFPFRITLPENVGGFSTVSYQDYRVQWRIQADLNHIPITGVGCRQSKYFELPLVRYDLPRLLPVSPPPFANINTFITNNRAYSIRYRIEVPLAPIGPLDIVSLPIHLALSDSAVSIRSASVTIERRIYLNDAHSSPSLPHDSLIPSPVSPISQSHLPSKSTPISAHRESSQQITYLSKSYNESTPCIFTTGQSSRSVSTPTSPMSSETELRPLLPRSNSTLQPTESPQKHITTVIAGTESCGRFIRNADGIWHKTLTLQWPATKSHSLWAIGETIQSDLVSVKFFVRAKVIVSSPLGTESIDLPEKELIIVSINESERKLAFSKYVNTLHASRHDTAPRSKSKSPRRTTTPHSNRPSSPQRAINVAMMMLPERNIAANPQSDSQRPPSSRIQKEKSKSRRPHTSAGPRDKLFDLSLPGTSFGHLHRGPPKGVPPDSRPGTAIAAVKVVSKPSLFKGTSVQGWHIAPKLNGNTSSANTSSSSSTNSGVSIPVREVEALAVREWEEELTRIEAQSRWSSVRMLGFSSFRRKRMNGRDLGLTAA